MVRVSGRLGLIVEKELLCSMLRRRAASMARARARRSFISRVNTGRLLRLFLGAIHGGTAFSPALPDGPSLGNSVIPMLALT